MSYYCMSHLCHKNSESNNTPINIANWNIISLLSCKRPMGYCCHPAGQHGQFVNNLQDYEIHTIRASSRRLREERPEPVFNSHSTSHCTKISTKYYSLWYIKFIMVKYCIILLNSKIFCLIVIFIIVFLSKTNTNVFIEADSQSARWQQQSHMTSQTIFGFHVFWLENYQFYS